MTRHALSPLCGLASSRARPQAAFNAARIGADALAAQYVETRAALATERREAAGLVSVSTSGFDALPVVCWMAENSIEIDPIQSRITRLRKGVGMSAKCHLHLEEGTGENNTMVTLTYRGDNSDWQPRHVSDYIRKVRGWFKDRCPGQRLKYVWVAELQKRGVIHYHAVFFLPVGVRMPQADRVGWWPHGMSNTLKATAPVAYLMKYASKADSANIGRFPRGARIYAVGGLDAPGAAIKRWVLWPAYVQGNASVYDRFRPAPGGGYVNAQTGQLLQSEYAPTGAGFTRFVRVRKTPRILDNPAGPFCWLGDKEKTIH